MAAPGLVLVSDDAGTLERAWLSTDVDRDATKLGGARVDVVRGVPEDALLARFVDVVAVHRPRRNLLLGDEPEHPFMRLTDERFPRLLATRRPAADDPRAFGPFLPRTAARRLLGLAGHLCRLRTCTIEVDGSFVEPCGEHAAGRCLAPCVRALCSDERYAEAVEDAARLAGGDWDGLAAGYTERMAEGADALDFEGAARWRDAADTLATLGPDLRLRAGLAGATDVVVPGTDGGLAGAAVATTFRGKVLGRRIFVGPTPEGEVDEAWLVAQVLAHAYRRDAPSTILATAAGPQARLVSRALGLRFGRRVEVKAFSRQALPPSLRLAIVDAEGRLAERLMSLRFGRPLAALDDLAARVDLAGPPRRIEAIDVAHLTGEAMTAAAVVCRDGEPRPEESAAWYVDAASELSAIEHAVETRAASGHVDLVLVDGGRAQLSAARRGLERAGGDGVRLVAVAKPEGRPRGVAYLLVPQGDAARRIELPEGSEALRLVQRLRDDAHAAANAAHRAMRERLQLAREPLREPIVVPTRFDDPNGAASDLIPIAPRLDAGRRPVVRPRRRRRPGPS